MRTKLPPYVAWSVIAVVVLLAGLLLYRAWTGGVHTHGESVGVPAPPNLPSGQMPGPPLPTQGMYGGQMPGAPGGSPMGTPVPPMGQ